MLNLFFLFSEQGTLGVHFVESWTYSACLDIVAACEAKLASQHASTPSVALVAVKAELLELAKKQVRAPFAHLVGCFAMFSHGPLIVCSSTNSASLPVTCPPCTLSR